MPLSDDTYEDLQNFRARFEFSDLHVDEVEYKGARTQLHNAAYNNYLRIAEYLLRRNANAGIKAKKGYTSLHMAAWRGHDYMVGLILKYSSRSRVKKFIDMQANDGSTALHLAAKKNMYEAVRLLLSYGANFEVKNKRGKKPIEVTTDKDVRGLLELTGEISRAVISAKNEDLHYLRLRLIMMPPFEYQAISFARNRQGYTLLQVAVDSKNMQTVKMILEIRMQRMAYEFALPGSVKTLSEDIKRYWHKSFKWHLGKLKNEGLSKKEMLREGSYAMDYAWMGLAAFEKYRDGLKNPLEEPNVKVIEEIIMEVMGFDPRHFETGNYEEEDAENFVTRAQSTRYYKLLTSNNADDCEFFIELLEFAVVAPMALLIKSLNSTNLLAAAKEGDIAAAEKCVEESILVDMNIRDTDERRPVHIAAAKGNLKMVELLLKNNADTLMETEEDEETSLQVAVREGHLNVVELLLFHCDVDKVNDYVNAKLKLTGETVLHLAAKKGRLDMIWCLMEHHAIYCLKDKRGKVPKDYAKTAEIKKLFEFVEEAFDSAKNGVIGIVEKFKNLEQSLLLVVGNVCDKEGHSVSQVATLNKHRDIGSQILRMVVEAKKNKTMENFHE